MLNMKKITPFTWKIHDTSPAFLGSIYATVKQRGWGRGGFGLLIIQLKPFTLSIKIVQRLRRPHISLTSPSPLPELHCGFFLKYFMIGPHMNFFREFLKVTSNKSPFIELFFSKLYNNRFTIFITSLGSRSFNLKFIRHIYFNI